MQIDSIYYKEQKQNLQNDVSCFVTLDAHFLPPSNRKVIGRSCRARYFKGMANL